MSYPAIETKFLGATDHRGERVKAFIPDWMGSSSPISPYNGWTETTQYDYALGPFENHQKVAQKLADRFFNYNDSGTKRGNVKTDEPITLVAGGTKHGYVWVRVNGYYEFRM